MRLHETFWDETEGPTLRELLFPDLPRPGWERRWYVVRQVWRLSVELAVFLLLIAAILGSVLLVWAAQS